MVTLRVADDGSGIPAEIRNRVFDRFVRGDSSRTRDGRGSSGLGMSIVELLARARAGRAAGRLEKGTVIDVTLPAALRPRVWARHSVLTRSVAIPGIRGLCGLGRPGASHVTCAHMSVFRGVMPGGP